MDIVQITISKQFLYSNSNRQVQPKPAARVNHFSQWGNRFCQTRSEHVWESSSGRGVGPFEKMPAHYFAWRRLRILSFNG